MRIPPEQRYWARFFAVDAAAFAVPGVRPWAAVVATAMADGFVTGELAMYQTWETNVAAVGVARRLGIRQHARQVAMRLAP